MRRNWQPLSACATSLLMLIHSPRNWACMPRSKSLQSAAPPKDRLRWSALPKESPQRRGLSMTITDVHDSSYMWSPNSPFASHQQWKEKIKKRQIIDWITTVYFGFTWFLSYLRGSNLCSSYEGRGISAPWQDHNGGDANIDEAHTRRPGAKIKLRASATGIHKNRMGGSTMMWVRSTWLCTVHAEWNARLALAGGGVKMF